MYDPDWDDDDFEYQLETLINREEFISDEEQDRRDDVVERVNDMRRG